MNNLNKLLSKNVKQQHVLNGRTDILVMIKELLSKSYLIKGIIMQHAIVNFKRMQRRFCRRFFTVPYCTSLERLTCQISEFLIKRLIFRTHTYVHGMLNTNLIIIGIIEKNNR